MRAHVGDWITVRGDGRARRGRIVAVPAPDGRPPYRVRWLDDERESFLAPPPDAVLSCGPPAQAPTDRKE